MFDKKLQAEALILDDEGSGRVVDTDLHGVDWDHHKYIVEVRPDGGEPFRVETKVKVPIFHRPQPGEVVKVSFDPKNHKTEIHIEGDPRYDPKLIRAKNKQDRAARAEALLSGAPAPIAAGVVHPVVDDEAPLEGPRDLPRVRRPGRPVHRVVRRAPHVRLLRQAPPLPARLQSGTTDDLGRAAGPRKHSMCPRVPKRGLG